MAKRHSAGEASIFQDADGRWHGWITVGTRANGKPDRRHRTARTRADVVRTIRELEVQRETGTVVGVRSHTVEAWLDHWLPNIAARRVRERTLESYESIIRMHITPHIGGQRIDKLQPEHLEQLYNLLLEQGLSPTTLLRVHRIISRALKVAMQRQRIHRNVATLVDPPAQRMSEVATALTLDEATAVLQTAKDQRNAARWTVAVALGLRQSEALALQWKDIDLLNGTLTVRRTLHRVKGKGLVYEPPKTKRSMRTLALPVPLIRALHEHKAQQLGERMLAGSEWQDDDLVFAQPNGRPIDKKADYKNWSDLLKRAGVRHVRLHDGRHTAATLLLSEGIHPRVVMELLGHSQMRTTMDIYSHVMPALAREAADRMGTVLLGKIAPNGPTRTPVIEGGLQPVATKDATKRISDDLVTGSVPANMGGAEGTRTPDPHTASVVRYQLRHSPKPAPNTSLGPTSNATRRPGGRLPRSGGGRRNRSVRGGKWPTRHAESPLNTGAGCVSPILGGSNTPTIKGDPCEPQGTGGRRRRGRIARAEDGGRCPAWPAVHPGGCRSQRRQGQRARLLRTFGRPPRRA
jgi:integrase